jgi:hypothetical protein
VNQRYLRIYLNDHLAGAEIAGRLAKRTLRQNPEGSLGEFLRVFVSELEEDRESLIRLMDLVDVPRDPLKSAGARAAEMLGRFKFNGHLLGYSPLSRLEELEFLSLGVEGKRLMWLLVEGLSATDRRLQGFDFGTLVKRAEVQRDELERHRLGAAAEAR